MKTNDGTVTISIEYFDDLRNFKKEVEEKNKTIFYRHYTGVDEYPPSKDWFSVITNDEAIKRLTEQNNSLIEKLEFIEKHGMYKGWKERMDSIKKMSYRQFRDWQRR